MEKPLKSLVFDGNYLFLPKRRYNRFFRNLPILENLHKPKLNRLKQT